MANERKPDVRRGEVSFIFAIILGLALGIFIRRIKIGILFGLALGLMIVFLGLLRTPRK